jgi:hypothetical protein
MVSFEHLLVLARPEGAVSPQKMFRCHFVDSVILCVCVCVCLCMGGCVVDPFE